MYYFVKTPFWLPWFFSKRIWKIRTKDKKLFLTFDDGPHPRITPVVLDLLKEFGAKATFFCIGNNIKKYPEVYARIIEEGHAVGNHTQNHLNGWNSADREYLEDVKEAKNWIDSHFFRPPYGKMTRFQEKLLASKPFEFIPVMWTILSADFDSRIGKEDCYLNVESNIQKGAIIVFHDSEKAEERMLYALEKTLRSLSAENWIFEKLA